MIADFATRLPRDSRVLRRWFQRGDLTVTKITKASISNVNIIVGECMAQSAAGWELREVLFKLRHC